MELSNSESEQTKDPLFVSSSYIEAVDKLEKDFESAFGYKTQRQLFIDFTRKYTTLPETWFKWFE